MQCVDILSRTKAETKVMHTNPGLVERRVPVRWARRAYDDASATADAVEDLRRIILNPHAKGFVQELVIKAAAGCDIAHGELNMGDAVNVDHAPIIARRRRLR
jgi:hypothetical protein